jgi:ribosome-binding factor A
MAVPRRRERLASVIEEVVSELLQREIRDPRVGAAMTSVTRVEVSADVRQAKIYVSVMGDEATRRETMRALEHASGFVRSKLGEELTIRHVPAITFQLDRSIEQGDQVLALINKMAAESAGTAAGAGAPPESAGAAPEESPQKDGA